MFGIEQILIHEKKNQVNLLQLKNILKGKRTCSKLNSIKTDRKTK